MGNVRLVSALVSTVLVPSVSASEETPVPRLAHAARVGGSNADAALDVVVDESGATYVAGWARSLDFPGCAPRSVEDGRDALVFKLAPDGQEILWSCALGGRDEDEAVAIALGPDGDVFVAGTTRSHDFPTTHNAHDRELDGGVDGFVARFSSAGVLRWSTLLGGQAEDELADLSVSGTGLVTVAGTTRSRDFPTRSGAFTRSPRGGRDVCVARLDASGQDLLFSCILGGSEDDEARALAVDADGACYVAGRTGSYDFPTTLGAPDRERSSMDGFVLKLSGGGRSLVWSSYLGGSGQDEALGLALDGAGRVLVVGWTQSNDFPFTGAVPARGRKDGFLAALTSSGNALDFATPLGGGSADEAWDVAVDPRGSAWVVGHTRSQDFPSTTQTLARALGGVADGFLAGVAPDGRCFYASTLGGGGEDGLDALACDPTGRSLALAGFALDVAREERGPLSGKRRGPLDAFVLRLEPHLGAPTTPSAPLQAALGF